MHTERASEAPKRVVDDLIARNTASTPTEPGLYRMPCGDCYVDFFIGADGTEHWLVPGDPNGYTRETVAIVRHGDHPWERMRTLGDAAAETLRRARAENIDPSSLLEHLATQEPATDEVKSDQ